MKQKILNNSSLLFTAAIILLDIFFITFSYTDNFLRCVFWLFIAPAALIINSIRNNKISNLVLIIYEAFLTLCNLLSFCFFTYENTITRFSVLFDDVFHNLNVNDGVYYFFSIFLNPLTISIPCLIIAKILHTIFKKKQISFLRQK